jgi:hypothetical protein
MILSRTCSLLVAATVLSGWLAGGNIDRAIVGRDSESNHLQLIGPYDARGVAFR